MSTQPSIQLRRKRSRLPEISQKAQRKMTMLSSANETMRFEQQGFPPSPKKSMHQRNPMGSKDGANEIISITEN